MADGLATETTKLRTLCMKKTGVKLYLSLTPGVLFGPKKGRFGEGLTLHHLVSPLNEAQLKSGNIVKKNSVLKHSH
jgi:hypothetical protein